MSRGADTQCQLNGEYVWFNAQAKSEARKHGLQGNHRKSPELWWRIEQLIMDEDWSPAQIAGVLRKEGIHIVKQTIYNHVHADRSGKLAAHMPHRLKYTRRTKALHPTKATNIANRTSIHERPKEADGTRFGDWEMDTIVDSFRTCHINPDRTIHQFYSYAETSSWTQSHAHGTDCGKASLSPTVTP